jgi:hypothetical protein
MHSGVRARVVVAVVVGGGTCEGLLKLGHGDLAINIRGHAFHDFGHSGVALTCS